MRKEAGRSDLGRSDLGTGGPGPALAVLPAPARRRPPRLSAGSVVPVVLAVLAAAFGYEALQDRSATVEVPVARVAIPAGAPVDAADTRLVQVHAADQALTAGLLPTGQLGQGWAAAVRIGAGQPITLSELTRPFEERLGAMSIEVPVEHAAGGTIGPGDLVDVVLANGSGGARYVAQGLRVLSVAPNPSAAGVLGGSSSNYFIVVAVNKLTALRLSAAIGTAGLGGNGGSIEVVRSTGEAPARAVAYQMGGGGGQS